MGKGCREETRQPFLGNTHGAKNNVTFRPE